MITTTALYLLVIDILAAAVAIVLERALAKRQFARRAAWLFALMSSAILAIAMLFAREQIPQPDADAAYVKFIWVKPILFYHATLPWSIPALYTPILDVPARCVWLMLCAVYILHIFGDWVRLRKDSRHWQRLYVDEQLVLVSDDTGPGAIGFLSPQVVVPSWIVTADRQIRKAVLSHELEHVHRHDNATFVLGAVLLAIAPWSPGRRAQLKGLAFAIEVDCDNRVVATNRGLDRSIYVRALRFVWNNRNDGAASDTIWARPSDVQRRIRILLAQ